MFQYYQVTIRFNDSIQCDITENFWSKQNGEEYIRKHLVGSFGVRAKTITMYKVSLVPNNNGTLVTLKEKIEQVA